MSKRKQLTFEQAYNLIYNRPGISFQSCIRLRNRENSGTNNRRGPAGGGFATEESERTGN